MSETDSPVDPLTPTASGRQTLSTQPAERVTYRDIPNYDLRDVIGRGGMGEVVLATDRRIDRDVALKRLRVEHPTPELVERFLREAKIQARLDHPSIAPVHELGFDSEALPFFTMKHITGTTLADVLDRKAAPRPRLLRALVDVCRALELAHSRRIVHRDLKPSNIMLGDYDAVYVIDWGVARILHADDGLVSKPPTLEDVISIDGVTKTGALLGTPGYMAPEQVRGEPAEPPADIYAIGSMLYEILAGAPLHPRGRDALATTIANTERSPSTKYPHRGIAPELDAICAAALATEPAERPTAKQLADTIQGYLDGDRDVERRRAVATELSVKARKSFTTGDYEEAMRTAGRALAFDPSSTAAAELVASVVIQEPKELPPDLEREVDAEETRMMRARSRRAVLPYAAIFLTIPVLPLVGVTDWPLLIAVYAAFAMMVGVTYMNSRVGVPVWLTLTGHTLTALMFSRLVGPFVITPIMLCAIVLSASSIPWLNKRWWAVAGWSAIAVLLPILLEAAHLLTPTWRWTPDGMISHGAVFDHGTLHPTLLVLANLGAVLLVAAYARRIGRDRSDAQRRIFVQAWHLRHLLPKARAKG
jgi:serine/threonine-protein kinase